MGLVQGSSLVDSDLKIVDFSASLAAQIATPGLDRWKCGVIPRDTLRGVRTHVCAISSLLNNLRCRLGQTASLAGLSVELQHLLDSATSAASNSHTSASSSDDG